MNLGIRPAVIADVHGQRRALETVLQRCRDARVSSLVLLGDLFDRFDQAETCAVCLRGWTVTGVLGNHEREALLAAAGGDGRPGWLDQLLHQLTDQLRIEDALFIHDGLEWKPDTDQLLNRRSSCPARVTFAGHTHVRQARDDNGPLDLSLGRVSLRSDRRYLINPGAVVDGQFAIWDRHRSEIAFERI